MFYYSTRIILVKNNWIIMKLNGGHKMSILKKYIKSKYMKYILRKEKKFKDKDCELSYLFLRKRKSKKLLVIFSGFGQDSNKKPVYNYILRFLKINCNKLYILDNFGPDLQGAYYLGEDKDFYISRAVIELINKIAIDNGISKDNIITLGSSKGGFASLYFALKEKYGAAIVSEPQTLLGSYLATNSTLFNFIGGELNNENIRYLDGLILNMIEKNKCPRLYLQFGKDGEHYTKYWLPLKNKLDIENIKYTIDLGNFKEHNELINYFPKFVIDSIEKEFKI